MAASAASAVAPRDALQDLHLAGSASRRIRSARREAARAALLDRRNPTTRIKKLSHEKPGNEFVSTGPGACPEIGASGAKLCPVFRQLHVREILALRQRNAAARIECPQSYLVQANGFGPALATARETGIVIMMKSDLHPPRNGPNADPVLYGIAAGLAELFPPVMGHMPFPSEPQAPSEQDPEWEQGDRD